MIPIIQAGNDFPRGYFDDWYKKPCVISLSSLADDRCIEIGRVDNPGGIMLLNQEQVKELIPVLQRFVNTGDINAMH
jgi:hypothetical protein